MNFIEAYKKGQEGSNRGLPMGAGLDEISKAINGLQRGMITVVAAAPKGGKSTLVDSGFVISPCLHVINNNHQYQQHIGDGLSPEQIKTNFGISYIDAEFIYFSYEIDRISKEFDFVAHFLNSDYGVEKIELDEGYTFDGKSVIDLSSSYLRGVLVADNDKIIKVKPAIFELVKIIYENRIIPFFGRYDTQGNLMLKDEEGNPLPKGMITFFENKDNPTGIRNYLLKKAALEGQIRYSTFTSPDGVVHKRVVGYKPNNPDKYVYVIMDHLRKLIPERGFTAKQTVDKFSEYSVELKIAFKYSFIHIIHLNRSMSDVSRMKQMEDMLYPNSDDVKETGNLAEDCDYLFTIFSPNDDRYNLNKHFGKMIKDRDGNLLYPNMRTIHLVESRHTPYPKHFRVNMFGGIKKFEQLKIK